MGLLVKCVETESVESVPVLWVGIIVGECSCSDVMRVYIILR